MCSQSSEIKRLQHNVAAYGWYVGIAVIYTPRAFSKQMVLYISLNILEASAEPPKSTFSITSDSGFKVIERGTTA